MRKRSHRYRSLPPLTPDARLMLKASVQQYGVRDAIDVDEDGHILDGHERWAICRELGIPCPSRTVSGLSDEGKRAYALQANLGRRQAGWDQLRPLARRLHREGYSASEIARLIGVGWWAVPTLIHEGDSP